MKNFKIRCIRNENDGFTKGKVYEVKNGVLIDDDNYKASVNFENVEDLNKFFESKFELVEKEPLKVGDYVVTKKKIKPSKELTFRSDMIIHEPTEIKKLSVSGNIELSNGLFYKPNWLKKVESPKEKKVFNIKDYDNKTVMHVDTQEKADKLCEYLKSIGIKQDRNKYWYIYEEDTCFEIFSDAYTNKEWYEKNGYTILEFDDFIFEKPKVEEDIVEKTVKESEELTINYESVEEDIEEYKGFKEYENLFVYVATDDRIENGKLCLSNKAVKWHIDNGYAFHTKEEAERKKECMEILNQYKHEFSLEEMQNDDLKKHYVFAFHKEKELRIDYYDFFQESKIVMKSKEDAEKVAELIGYDDWCKYILNLR